MAETDKGGTTCPGVLVSFAVDCAETLGLGLRRGCPARLLCEPRPQAALPA